MKYYLLLNQCALLATAIPARRPSKPLADAVASGVTVSSDDSTGTNYDATTVLQKRSKIQSTCGGREAAIKEALQVCASRARAGQQFALDSQSGSDIMKLFFKNDDESTRQRVANLLSKVAKECEANGDGETTIGCTENEYKLCVNGGGTKAYSNKIGGSEIYLCDVAFNEPFKKAKNCGARDLAFTMLHEMTHSRGSTNDFSSYGINAVQRLTPDQNIQHADSYALFATAVASKCTAKEARDGLGAPTFSSTSSSANQVQAPNTRNNVSTESTESTAGAGPAEVPMDEKTGLTQATAGNNTEDSGATIANLGGTDGKEQPKGYPSQPNGGLASRLGNGGTGSEDAAVPIRSPAASDNHDLAGNRSGVTSRPPPQLAPELDVDTAGRPGPGPSESYMPTGTSAEKPNGGGASCTGTNPTIGGGASCAYNNSEAVGKEGVEEGNGGEGGKEGEVRKGMVVASEMGEEKAVGEGNGVGEGVKVAEGNVEGDGKAEGEEEAASCYSD
ncbi:hypothetical protein RJ55_10022 [Drechmeria coniospora]|nr:hypothetical protein RJ55_10022 [Drechmeria coniospora]